MFINVKYLCPSVGEKEGIKYHTSKLSIDFVDLKYAYTAAGTEERASISVPVKE